MQEWKGIWFKNAEDMSKEQEIFCVHSVYDAIFIKFNETKSLCDGL